MHILYFNPLPPIETFLTHLQQTTFENIATKGEIGQNELNFFFSYHIFISRDFPYLEKMFSKSSAADLLYV